MAVKYVDIEYLRAQNASAGQLILAGSSNTLTYTPYITVDINGNVGIGTAIPSESLTVQGNIKIQGANAGVMFADGSYQQTAAYPSSGAAGSIQFASSGGQLSSDANNLYWDSVNRRIGIGTNAPLTTFQVKDTAWESTKTGPFSGTSTRTLDSFSALNVRSAHYLVQVTDETNSRYHTSQIMVVQDGLTAFKSEYNIVTSHDKLGDFDAQVSGGNLILLFTPHGDTVKTVKITRTSMTA
jgi:hypothetical protein